jgi:hypothetical protein
MGEVLRFVPKSEREGARLIREARVIYDSIFPSAHPVNGEQDRGPLRQTVSGANSDRGDGGLLS